MKRGIFMVTLTVLLLTLAIWEAVAVSGVIDNLSNSIDSIIDDYKNNKNDITVLLDNVSDIKSYWDDRECTLCLIFNHKDLSAVTDSLSKLKTYTYLNDYDDALTELYLLQNFAYKADHIMGFNIHNIF